MPEQTTVLCLVSEWPSPQANDARLRELARLLGSVGAPLTRQLTVAAIEPGGPAPRNVPFETVDLRARPVDWLTKHTAPIDLLLTAGVFAPAIEDAIANLDATRRVALLSRLPSHAVARSEHDYRAPDSQGLGTLLTSLRAHERIALDRCDHVACDDLSLADAVRSTGTSTPATVGFATLPDRIAFTPVATRRMLHLGRWATGTGADAVALRSLLAQPQATDARLAVRTTLIGEDCSPAGRQVTRDFPRVRVGTSLNDEIMRGAVAPITATTGPAVTARILELAAMGVPLVLSKAMTQALPNREALVPYITDTPAQAVSLLAVLLDDDDAWQEASDTLTAWADGLEPIVLDGVTSHEPSAWPQRQWPMLRRRGAFDFQREMQRFEDELIPEPALDRDDTALLQPNMTEDERYRLKLRVHDRPSYFARCAAGVTLLQDDPSFHMPTFSIVMPTYNIDRATLLSAIESVRSQLYPKWQLCIADDASTNEETRQAVREVPDLDDRISVTLLEDNIGIAGATNAAIELATGEFVGFLDHDDELRPDALYWYARLLQARPDLDVIYSDEDKLNAEGEYWWPFHKPDWSPAMLTNVNYMTHFLVTRRSHLASVEGVRTGFDGAQDYDLILRLTAATEPHRIGHVAKPLYSWRVVEGSTAGDIEAKPAAHDAGHRALTDWLATQPGPDGFVTDGSVPTVHFVRYAVPDDVKVSVIIPTKDRVDLMRLCLESVRAKTDFDNYELIVVDNNTTDPETLAWLDEFARTSGRVIKYPHQFNYGRQMNLAAAEASGELLLFLNNDAQVHTDHWMRAMAEQALLPDVGAVGARLMFPDGRTQHEGIGLGMAGPAVNLSFGGHRGYDQFIRDCAAVTGAAMMMRASVFDDVGGFDDKLRVAFNDVDLCLRIGERGYRNVYTPLAELGHPESASRGSLHPIPDEDLFHRRWGTKGQLRDPWLNRNFEWFAPLLYRI